MNQEIGQEWVKRLRSGDYPQGKVRLRNGDDTYCCLGVLCEIAVEQGEAQVVTQMHDINPGDKLYIEYRYSDGESLSAHVLPRLVAEWAGLPADNPKIPIAGSGFEELAGEIYGAEAEEADEISLAMLNDNGAKFPQIADAIEKFFLSNEEVPA